MYTLRVHRYRKLSCFLESDTSGVKSWFGRTFWLTLILLFLIGGLGKWIARLEIFQAPLTPPRMGSRHYQLGHKLALLDRLVERNGPVDCIMLGSSIVDTGFDPAAFESGYREITVRVIRCFSFGIDTAPARPFRRNDPGNFPRQVAV